MTPVSEPSGAPPGPPASLISALRRMLRPWIRLLLAHQLQFPFLSRLLKEVYLQVALEDFPVPDRPQTDSRLSLLTGLHRKDVRRLREVETVDSVPPRAVSLGAQLVARWTGRSEFRNEDGTPKALPRHPSPAADVSFESLVSSCSRDIRPRAVLDEWLRLGVAHLDADDRVVLNAAAFIPVQGFDEKAYYLGRNLGDHIAAAAHNLLGEGPPVAERSVYYDDLTVESLSELSELAERLGMDALQAVNRRALELQERDRGRAAARHRINFGIYVFRDDLVAGTRATGEPRDDT